MDTSASLRTTGIWANTIGCVARAARTLAQRTVQALLGLAAFAPLTRAPARRSYDPYAPVNGEPAAPPPGENVYEKSKGLMAMARLTGGVQVDEDRGAWKGHGRLKGFNAPGRCGGRSLRGCCALAGADAGRATDVRAGARRTRPLPARLAAWRRPRAWSRRHSACDGSAVWQAACVVPAALTRWCACLQGGG